MTKNRNEYWTQYKKDHYARIVIDVTPEIKERWQLEARKRKQSLSQMIKDIVQNEVNRRK